MAAYLFNPFDLVKDDFDVSKGNFTRVKLPNVDNFYNDDRETSEKAFWNRNPCMTNCTPDPSKVTGRACVIDLTPDHRTGPRVE